MKRATYVGVKKDFTGKKMVLASLPLPKVCYVLKLMLAESFV